METRLVTNVEPWLRGSTREVEPVRRAVLDALLLAGEDAERWCASLSDEAVNARPGAVAPVAFHLRHIARSLDRLLTYAEEAQLSEAQLAALREELAPGARTAELMEELRAGLARAAERILAFDPADFEAVRGVGRERLPTTLAGLLIHSAEHTQRHSGQAITTAQIASRA